MAIKTALKSLEDSGKNMLRTVLVSSAIRELRKSAEQVTTIEEAVKLVEDFRYCRIQIEASQVRSEITGLLKLLASRAPKTVLEIGTYKGGTFFLFTRVAAADALLVSLDLPLISRHVGYPPWRGRLFQSFGRAEQRIKLVQADSHLPETAAQIRDALEGRPLDFLFIDGDHSYAGVKADFELYSPLVRPGGCIGFHDIVPGPSKRVGGVPQFWKELKQNRKGIEFVADWNQGGFGIGVIELA